MDIIHICVHIYTHSVNGRRKKSVRSMEKEDGNFVYSFEFIGKISGFG